MKLCILNHLRSKGVDTWDKLRAAHLFIRENLRVNPSFDYKKLSFIDGYIDHS
jgi:hypothetical protein